MSDKDSDIFAIYSHFYFAPEDMVVLEQEREAYFLRKCTSLRNNIFAIFLSLKSRLHVQQRQSNSNSYTFNQNARACKIFLPWPRQ